MIASMRRALLLLPCLLVAACSDHPPTPQGVDDLVPASQDNSLSDQPPGTLDRPAPPISRERFPVVSLPGYEHPADAAIFTSRQSPPATPSPGLDAPEMGQGEFSSVGWELPDPQHDAAPAETLPQIQEEPPQAPPPPGEIIPHEQVIEDIPLPINIVEDIPR